MFSPLHHSRPMKTRFLAAVKLLFKVFSLLDALETQCICIELYNVSASAPPLPPCRGNPVRGGLFKQSG